MENESGYGAARQLHAGRLQQGWRAVGRKIGFTNRTIWPRYGVYEPIWGMVYDRTLVVATGDRARVALEGLANPRIEPEICFGLKAAPPRSNDPAALLDAIDWVAHSIEIVQCPHPQWKTTLEEAQAQNGLHGRLVVGTPLPVDSLPGLAALLPQVRVVLSRGSAQIDSGVGANVLDSPLLALAYLLGVLARQPDAPPLAAGEIVSTGTLTDAHPVHPGETWSTTFTGLPLAGLTIEFI
jgi:2-keto-4-pentenoate hydratase